MITNIEIFNSKIQIKSDISWWKACELLFKWKEQFCFPLIHNRKTLIINRDKADILKKLFISNSTVDDSSTDPLGGPPAAEQ